MTPGGQTRVRSIRESLDFIFNFEVGRVRLVKADPPRSALEIGTAMGGTLFLLSRAAC